LRDTINDAWKEVYYQLGRNKTRPLNDDEFLKPIGRYISSIAANRRITSISSLTSSSLRKSTQKDERQVELEAFEEQRSDAEIDEPEDDNEDE